MKTKRILKRTLALVLTAALLAQTVSMRFFDSAYAADIASDSDNLRAELIDTDVPVTVLGEVKSLRTEDAKHFRMSDGTYMLVSYGMPVHYEDENGQWQDIDNRLVLSEDQNTYSTYNAQTATTFAAGLSSGSLFTASRGGTSVSMGLLDTAQANQIMTERKTTNQTTDQTIAQISAQAEKLDSVIDSAYLLTYDRAVLADTAVETETVLNTSLSTSAKEGWTMDDILPKNLQSSILYEDVFPGVDLLYTKYSHNVKEQIIVNEPQSSYRYDFEVVLDGVEAVLNEDGSVSLLDEMHQQIYYIPAPFMQDDNGVISYDAEYILTPTGEGIILSVVADADWMNDESRAYPVAIDPTIHVQAGDTDGDIYTTYVIEGLPDNAYCKATDCYAGYVQWNDLKENRTYMHFNNLPDVPAGMVVVDAQLALCLMGYTYVGCAELELGIYPVTDSLPSTYTNYYDWFNAMTWNTRADYDDENMIDYVNISDAVEGQYQMWEMTGLVKEWYIEGTQNRTIALALAQEKDKYSDTYCAEGHFYAWGSVAPPMLLVSYRSNVGLESYYTYNTIGVGDAGTAYIADATGQLKVAKGLVSYASAINPFALSLVYNSDYFSADSEADYQPSVKKLEETTELNPAMQLGQGWTLDIIRTMETVVIQKPKVDVIDEVEYICYHDGDGTKHYFRIDEARNAAYKEETGIDKTFYYDEDGLGLKAEKTGADGYLMYDDQGNIWTFTGGKLTSSQDENGNKYTINYSNNKITSITQTNNGQVPITVATFAYSENYVSGITDAVGNEYSFVYNGDLLTGIKRNDTVIAEYGYNGHRLNRMLDTDRQYAVVYSYLYGRVASYVEAGDYSALEPAEGAGVAITYPSYSKTVYRTAGSDHVHGNEDDLLTYYLFDHAGRTVNAYTTDTENNLLSATNAVYTGTGSIEEEGVDKRNNRTQRTAGIGASNATLLDNGGFELEETGWTLSSDLTISNGAIDTTNPRTGQYSLKVIPTKSVETLYATVNSHSLTAGETYTLSAYVNTSESAGISGNGIFLRVSDSANNLFTGKGVNYITSEAVDDGWVRIQLTFTAVLDGVHTVGIGSVGAQGPYYVDDVQLEKAQAPGSHNLLENGSMETNHYRWTGTNAVWVSDGGWNGSTAIKITGSPIVAANASQTVPIGLSVGHTYVLSGWAKANGVPDNLDADGVDPEQDVTKQFGLRAIITYSNNATEYHYVPFNADLTEWQFASLTIVPERAEEENLEVTSIRVVCAYEGNANTAYFDNLSLTREAAQTMRYDDDGNLVSVTTTGLSEDVNDYSGGNLISTVTGGNGTYTYTYDEEFEHRLTSATDGVITQTMGYDGVGNVTTTTLKSSNEANPLTISTSASYQHNGNLLSTVTDAVGNQVSYGYGGVFNQMTGLPSTLTDGKGTVIASEYDSQGRLIKTAIGETAEVDYSYHAGNLYQIYVKDNLNDWQIYGFEYDVFGNMTKVTLGGRGIAALATYTYGGHNGYLQRLTYGNLDSISYTYDILGRVIKETYSDGRKVDYVYTGDGQLYSATDSVSGTTYYTYDSLHRLIYSYQEETGVRIRYTYDSNNRLTRADYSVEGWSDSYESYTYNGENETEKTDAISDGMLTGMQTVNGGSISLSYDYLQRLTGRTVADQLTETFTYAAGNGENKTTTLLSGKTNTLGQTVQNNFQYTYDGNGNILTVTDTVSGKTVTYTYDNQNQLTGAVHSSGRTESYTYTTGGNLLTFSNGVSSHTYTYDNPLWRDMLTAVDGVALTYDDSGNPTDYYNGESYAMTWTEGRRLATVTSDAGGSTAYQYNGDGLRTRKQWQDGSYIQYLIADGTAIGEKYYNTAGTLIGHVRYIFDENGSVCGYSRSTDGTTWTDYYFIRNLQGDVLKVFRASDNAIVAEYSYDSWGNILSATGEQAEANPFRYRGYYYDRETGLYYLESRYYDPEIGRFINADNHLSTGQSIIGFNMFAYCLNNPVNYVDSDGEDAEALQWWTGTMWWLCGVDTFLPIGDIVFGAGILIFGIYAMSEIDQITTPEICYEEEAESAEQEPPSVPYPGNDPTVAPGQDYEWAGKEPVGGDKGTWLNKKTGEQLHPDLNHPDPIGPHWDYTNGLKPKLWWRILPDGTMLPK